MNRLYFRFWKSLNRKEKIERICIIILGLIIGQIIGFKIFN